ncbi:glycerate kinase type-2 family protein [Nitrosomonas eutropha]|uniref:Hydroxypyruvate reductase n=2 Tax=Nitrosomonas eutropha TaxID=916 RepID=A0ABX5M675_9PROT|nr:glycerate kinase [Nitrosomonas eutropha]ABI60666.1 Hydroxypyruvate reductase [Nitrosomonas eutropha C91]PXV80229.1 hydroxypyruvate reductase [Nitrosomonas eutropha]SEI90100.1 hydroxypyruvate reductase [Nitrosomonas eutropha]
MNPRELLLDSFHAAVNAADPLKIVPCHLPEPPRGNTLVVGAGKAAAAMARAVEENWPADHPLEGIVVTPYGHGLATNNIMVIEASHPVPDTQGEMAARAMLESARILTPNDLLLGLFSGGGSSLLSAPIPGVTLDELKSITRQLLRCGAAIQEINIVRKHLSVVLGGRLAAASRASVHSLIISDVTDNDPSSIASGPCAPDPSTWQDVLALIERYAINIAPQTMGILQKNVNTGSNETPKLGDPVFRNVKNRIIATARQSLAAAAQFFRAQGITPLILGDTVTGEAKEIAKMHAAIAREVRHYSNPFKPPVALISGGETTVTVTGSGRGGRNAEFLLSLAIALNGLEEVYALACDTDGIDGNGTNAGAVITPDTLNRVEQADVNPVRLLDDNDAWTFFDQLDDLIVTGPTRTNVNDYRVVLVL